MDFGLLKCDMDLDIIQVELYNTYLPSMYYIGWRGEYAICCIYKLYIYIYPTTFCTPQNQDIPAVFDSLILFLIDLSI